MITHELIVAWRKAKTQHTAQNNPVEWPVDEGESI